MTAKDPRLIGLVLALGLVGLLARRDLPSPTLLTRAVAQAQQQRLEKRAPAPALKLPRATDGQLLRLSLRGHQTLLFFTTPTCPYCRQLKQALLDQGLPDLGERLVIVSQYTPGHPAPPEVEKTEAEIAARFTVVLDSTRNSFEAYKVQGVPTSYLIDAEGKVVDWAVGVPGGLKLLQSLMGGVLTLKPQPGASLSQPLAPKETSHVAAQ